MAGLSARHALAGFSVAAVVSGCDSCEPRSRNPRSYPAPLEQSARPHVGEASRRWSGPCWRDFATPDRVGASTSIEYDEQGFITALTHHARTRGGFRTAKSSFQRQKGGALILEQRQQEDDDHGPSAIRYEFSELSGDVYVAVKSMKPVLAEAREKAQLCLCPADDRSVCYVGERLFCRGHEGTLFSRPDPRLSSCIACGDRVEIEERTAGGEVVRRSWTRTDRGAKLEYRSRKTPVETLYRLDLTDNTVVETQRWLASGKAQPELRHRIPYASMKDFCGSDARQCRYDVHGNLLEFAALNEAGAVVQRDVLSYACRE